MRAPSVGTSPNITRLKLAIRQVFRFVVYGAAGLAMLFLVALAGLAIRLAEGPVPLAFLLPSLEYYLDRTVPQFAFRIDTATATWRGWESGLALGIGGINIADRKASGRVLVLPKVNLVFGAEALRHGVVVPATIEIDGARFDLVRSADGIAVADRGDGDHADGTVLASLFDELLAPPDPARPLSYVERVVIRNGAVTLIDAVTGNRWQARVHEASLTRGADRIAVDAALAVAAEPEDVPLTLTGDVDLSEGHMDASIAFAGLDASRLAAVEPALAPLAALALPLSGEVTLRASRSAAIERVAFDLRGGPGELRVSQQIAEMAGDSSLAQTLGIEALNAAGTLTFPRLSAEINTFRLVFAPRTEVFVPPLDHRFPLRSLVASGRYADDSLVVEDLNIDLDGPTLAAAATALNLTGALTADGKLRVRNLTMDGIQRYWPKAVAPGGLKWCARHLSLGIVTMDVELALANAGNGVDLSRLSAALTGEGARIDYLPGLPPIDNARARGTLDLERLALVIEGGNAGDLVVRGGTVVLADFNKAVETIAIDLEIAGPLAEAIDVISREPLALTKGLDLDTSMISGRTAVRLQMGFPLREELPIEDVRMLVTADIRNAAIVPGLFNIPVRDGDLDLRVTNQGLRLGGTAELAGIRGRVLWEEDFRDRAAVPSRITFTTKNAPVRRIDEQLPGIDLGRFFKAGTVNGDVEFFRRATLPYQLFVKLDLSNSEVTVPHIGWIKPRGTRAVAEATVTLDDQGLTGIPKLSAYGGGLVFDGSVDFDGAGALRAITVEQLIAGRTNVRATASHSITNRWDIEVTGSSLDLEPIRGMLERGERIGLEGSSDATAPPPVRGGELTPSISFSSDVENVWFGEDRSLHRVTATAVREAELWTLAQLDARFPEGGMMMATLTVGAQPGQRSVRVHATDAGAALRALDLYDNMGGGRLHITGDIDDTKDNSPLQGQLEIRNFTISRAPVLARLLNVLALGGILDALRDSGISFQRLIVPFVWINDSLRIEEARTYGISLGMTASGGFDLAAGTMDLRGTLVPFYFFNSALGRLPLVGPLFTGDEKGGGLFAAAYRIEGPLDDPDVTVNPLSTLLPGFLREVLLWLQELIFPSPPTVP